MRRQGRRLIDLLADPLATLRPIVRPLDVALDRRDVLQHEAVVIHRTSGRHYQHRSIFAAAKIKRTTL